MDEFVYAWRQSIVIIPIDKEASDTAFIRIIFNESSSTDTLSWHRAQLPEASIDILLAKLDFKFFAFLLSTLSMRSSVMPEGARTSPEGHGTHLAPRNNYPQG